MGATLVVFYVVSRVPSGELTRPKSCEWGLLLGEAAAVKKKQQQDPGGVKQSGRTRMPRRHALPPVLSDAAHTVLYHNLSVWSSR
eukprot:3224741-Prymnesium_polylepis.1